MFFHIKDINYVVLDSDSQQLTQSPVPNRVLLRSDTTRRSAAEESESEIAALFDDDTKMVIIVAGLGGETGTDVAPVVARIAREKEVTLTVGIVTTPFLFEGSERIQMALAGIEDMRKHVDALFVINNQHLTEIYNDLDQSNAFAKSDETLTTAECRVTKALEDAFESPLLKDCDIYSSRKMMMNFYYNPDSEFLLQSRQRVSAPNGGDE